MSIKVFYNEIDPFCCAWLSNLMDAGAIRPGTISDKSIADLTPDDVKSYEVAHFFAGIAGWEHALALAGYGCDGRVTWTGSCPCQPFSVAGKGRGTADERHLWPEWFRLIRECRPSVVFGEQVESAVRHGWLDGISADLESEGYAVGSAVLGAHSVGAPHIRQRLFWVAQSEHAERGTVGVAGQDVVNGRDAGRAQAHGELGARGEVRGLAVAGHERQGRGVRGSGEGDHSSAGYGSPAVANGGACGMGNANEPGSQRRSLDAREHADERAPWSRGSLIECADGKARRFEPGIFPLAPGLPKGVVRGRDPGAPINANATAEARVGRLRGYGNAIVPQLAAVFIRAFLDVTE